MHKNKRKNSEIIYSHIFGKACKRAFCMVLYYLRDCDRYALKRKVAALDAGFFVEYVRF